MAITFTEQRKLQRNLLAALGGFFFLTIFVVWWGFLREPSPSLPPTILPPARTVKINFEVFDSEAFTSMTEPLLQVIPPETIGRQNPFLP